MIQSICDTTPRTFFDAHASLHDSDSPRRPHLEDWIGDGFRRVHGAEIHEFLASLLAVESAVGELTACCGFASASHGETYLERYLDHPVEALLTRYGGRSVDRHRIVEIGNLAAEGPKGLGALFVCVDSLLRSLGFEWAVFTATRAVRIGLRRMRFQCIDLGAACGAAMGDDLAEWGSYYDADPRVIAIHYDSTSPIISPCLMRLAEQCRILGESRKEHAA